MKTYVKAGNKVCYDEVGKSKVAIGKYTHLCVILAVAARSEKENNCATPFNI